MKLLGDVVILLLLLLATVGWLSLKRGRTYVCGPWSVQKRQFEQEKLLHQIVLDLEGVRKKDPSNQLAQELVASLAISDLAEFHLVCQEVEGVGVLIGHLGGDRSVSTADDHFYFFKWD